MLKNSKIWVQLALLNLCIVAGVGMVMRYKIAFEFPHLNQKFLQEAHSHFAFAGWITHCLFFMVVGVLRSNLAKINEGLYRVLILFNLASAYGMLICFAIQGYGPVSLFFSTLSLLTGYVFAYFALRDLSRLPKEHPGKKWIQAALWLGVISTFGTMVLSTMMATKNYDQDTYLGSVFFYLHFQYNGWFLFTCIGLFFDHIKQGIAHAKLGVKAFWLMLLACVPAYFLSTLWANIPVWLYALVAVAAIVQVIGLGYLIAFLRKNLSTIQSHFSKTILRFFLIVGLAISLKFMLQLGSTVPSISKLAFGFRPIVIAYLHLVLLVVTTLFLLSFIQGTGLIRQTKMSISALTVFAGAAILTECVLMLQGIAGFSYAIVPLSKELLLLFSLLLFGAAIAIFFNGLIKDKNDFNQRIL
jgi:hypothetical protein